jgi:hypothetical protein
MERLVIALVAVSLAIIAGVEIALWAGRRRRVEVIPFPKGRGLPVDGIDLGAQPPDPQWGNTLAAPRAGVQCGGCTVTTWAAVGSPVFKCINPACEHYGRAIFQGHDKPTVVDLNDLPTRPGPGCNRCGGPQPHPLGTICPAAMTAADYNPAHPAYGDPEKCAKLPQARFTPPWLTPRDTFRLAYPTLTIPDDVAECRENAIQEGQASKPESLGDFKGEGKSAAPPSGPREFSWGFPGDEPEPEFDPDKCSCAASPMPPCSYCEPGYRAHVPTPPATNCAACGHPRPSHVATGCAEPGCECAQPR